MSLKATQSHRNPLKHKANPSGDLGLTPIKTHQTHYLVHNKIVGFDGFVNPQEFTALSIHSG